MKNQIILLIALFSFSITKAQINDSGNHGLMTISTKKNARMSKIEGSPYENRDFVYGVASVEGKTPLKAFLRYDVSSEDIEIKTDLNSEEIYVLPVSENAVYTMNGKTYFYDEMKYEGKSINGYFIRHFKGDNVKLLEKPTIEITEAVKAKTGYEQDRPARYDLDEDFYLVWEEGKVIKVDLKHRDVKKTFNSGKARKYLSDNRIRSISDLIAFAAFLDKQ